MIYLTPISNKMTKFFVIFAKNFDYKKVSQRPKNNFFEKNNLFVVNI